MKTLTNQKKLELIVDLCKKHDITAYEIAKETGLNASGLHRILSKEVKSPRGKTLNKILDYLDKKLPGRDLQGHHNYVPKETTEVVNEPVASYSRASLEILGAIERLEKILEHRTDAIASSVAYTMLNTDDILTGVRKLHGPIDRLIELNEARK